jgi:hypothetical protein
MFGSEVLDVGVGLVFVFLLLSLACSAANELLEAAVKYRARALELGLRELLDDPQAAGLVRRFYGHPLVSSLFRGAYDPNSKGNLPTYIPARTFALALMDVLQPASATVLSGAAGALLTPLPSTPAPAVPTAGPVQQFRQTIAALPASQVRTALLSLLDAAGDDASRARQNIEDWYNTAMDRVSGWYKRRTQAIIAVIGLALVVAVNADTVGIARYLSTNKTARALIVSQAEAAVRPAPGQPAGAPPDLKAALQQLDEEGALPLGWKPEATRDWRRVPQSGGEWALKILGLLLTTFAVSLGAPFWFDMLNKIMVVRSTIKSEDKAAPQASKT